MQVNYYQRKTHETFLDVDKGFEARLSRMVLGLIEEAVEVGKKVKKYLREDYEIDELNELVSAEIGDVMWYVSEVCNTLGLDLNEICKDNLDKLRDRKKRGVIKGNGDNR